MRDYEISAQLSPRDIEVLLAVHQAGGETGLSDLVGRFGQEDEKAVRHSRHALMDLGLLDKEVSLAAESRLTGLGRDVAEWIVQDRTSGEARFEAVQRALLTWVRDDPHVAEVEGFVGHESATAYGVPFTEEEILDAGEDLAANGLIEGVDTGDHCPIRPEVTSKGRAALRSSKTIREFLGGGPAQVSNTDNRQNHTTIHGDVAGYQVGDHNKQTVHAAWGPQERDQVAAQLQQALGLLKEMSEEAAESVRAAVEEAHREAQSPTATRASLKGKIADALAKGIESGVASGVTQLLAAAVTSLG